MPLPGTVATAPAGAKGFDTNTPLTAAQCAAMKASGFSFCLRYISRGAEGSGDLNASEATHILQAGLALMPVQHVALSPWHPTGTLGTTNGQAAVTNTKAIGFPDGVNVWLDLEGVAFGTATQDVVDYCNAWFDQVDGVGFVSGLYVGPAPGLNADDLYHRLKVRHYWKAGAGSTPNVSQRGFQMFQHLTETVNHLSIDRDDTANDAFGDAVLWLAPTG